MSVDDVCTKTGRARSTVCGYLSDYLRAESVTDPSPWASPQEIAEVEAAIVATQITDRLRPLFDHTEGKISYDSIRIVVACYANRLRKDESEVSRAEGSLS